MTTATADSSRDRLTHRDLDVELLVLAEMQREALERRDWKAVAWTLISSTLLRAIAHLDERAVQAQQEQLLLPVWIETDEADRARPPVGIVELAKRAARINTHRGQN